MTDVEVLYKMIDNGREGKNIGLKTGIPKMDKYTGGFQRGVYTLIFGLSGSGKSSWVLYTNIYRPLKDYPDKDIKLVYYSLEMSAELLLAKLLCLYIYEEFGKVISYTDLMSWQDILNDDLYQYVLKAKSWLKSISSKLIIFDKALTSKSFYSTLMMLLKQWGDFIEVDDGKRTAYISNNPERYVGVVIDHIGLCSPQTGRTKKEEMDEISKYAVRLRERCNISFFVLQQENRNSSGMDRQKAGLTECSSEDLKDTGNTFNDCEICIGIYNPLKFKIKVHRGIPIIIENAKADEFKGLRDRYRAACLIKNRLGASDRIVKLNFFGEIGLFKEMPETDENTNFAQFCDLVEKEDLISEDSDTHKEVEEKTPITFNF